MGAIDIDITDLGKTPISTTEPAGRDMRGEATFEAISAEIDKLSSPVAATGVDWRRLLELSHDILATGSKDILVFSYLSMALLKTKGLDGLAGGVHVLRDGLTNFWDIMFPPKSRMRGRKNALDWWAEKITSALAGFQQVQWPGEKIDAFLDDLKALDEFLKNNMDDPPLLSPLAAAAASLIQTLGESPPAPPQTSPASDRLSPGRPEPTPSLRETVSSDEGDPERIMREAADSLRRASALFLQKNPFHPLRFRLNRVISWVSVTAPPTSHEGKTLIQPPDTQVIDTLKSLRQAQDWQALLEAAESRVTEFLFWFDLHRYTWESLDNMGHKAVAVEIADQTALYAKRLPGIALLSFSDGTPFADADTREWLEAFTRKADTTTSICGGADQLMSSIDEQVTAARTRAKDGDLAGALRALKDRIDGAPSSRERFIWQISFCRFLVQAGPAQLSVPYLQSLLRDLDAYRVEAWDPLLAVECLTVVLSSLGLQKDGGDEEMRRKALGRLSLLDPARALAFIV